ncbi:MAG: acyltransferase domain-containing protein, partial [Gammaproteobacteria bacterium]|nr:acyltransferase domain-containing protein [Gammaproteobacteria bacterium]
MDEYSDHTDLEIAVIGMSGRYSDFETLDEFWNALLNGKELIEDIPEKNLNELGIDKSVYKQSNYVRRKATLKRSLYFDNEFFGLTPKEAEIADPQLRLLFENCWSALESSGYNPLQYPGKIGLFGGASENRNWQLKCFQKFGDNPSELYNYQTLIEREFYLSRIAYCLNLTGPVINIQTTCSTSLVAIHLACQSLLSGECDIGIAAGSSINPLSAGYVYQKGMILSPDGHCRTFDKNAQGTVGGEGVGVVVLKRLNDAIADRDNIFAVIKGSFINNDGNDKVSYTAPSVRGQYEVIKSAHAAAEIDAESISYIECHGTATFLGDPIEVEALRLAFDTSKTKRCSIGSVKSNIGHLDAAAGITGFIKTVLSLKNRIIPKTLHYTSANPNIDFENSPFTVNQETTTWQSEGLLRAGVSSFGIGGTNAHLILEEYSRINQHKEARQWQVIPLSAQTEFSLLENAKKLGCYLEQHSESNLANIGYTLQTGRQFFQYRQAYVAKNVKDLIAKLGDHECFNSHFESEDKPKIYFLFPGQGSQYKNMAKELYESEKYFRDTVDKCSIIAEEFFEQRITDILFTQEDQLIYNTENAQLSLFVIEYSITKLLIHWGIQPSGMIGHSIGEYVAACVSGVLSLVDALKIVAIRGKLMSKSSAGAMTSVQLSVKELSAYLNKDLAIAAVNSSNMCVLSGSIDSIEELESSLSKNDITYRRLKTSKAFHSQLLDGILSEFNTNLEAIKIGKPSINYISNVFGDWIAENEITAQYWTRHLRETVQFSDGLSVLLKNRNAIFVEVGPGNTLSTFASCHKDYDPSISLVTTLPHINDNTSSDCHIHSAIAKLFVSGADINWNIYNSSEDRETLSLPTYHFARRKFDMMLRESNISISDNSFSPSTESFKTLTNNRPKHLGTYVAPSGDEEIYLANQWSQLFHISPIGINDNYFDLGGNSLLATQVTNNICREFSVEIEIALLFENPTIKQFAEKISEKKRNVSLNQHNISVAPRTTNIPLTFQQQRLWFIDQLENGSAHYNLSLALCLEGELDRRALVNAFQTILDRHESLRTVFQADQNGVPSQVILQDLSFEFTVNDLSISDRKEMISEPNLIDMEFSTSFDLGNEALIRARLIVVDQSTHWLAISMHHIASDGWSIGLLVNELSRLYQAYQAGDENPLPPLPIQYAD